MTTIGRPICMGCSHYEAQIAGFRCKAYPAGIPLEIIRSEVDHRRPHAGDSGIVFAPKSKVEADYADEVFGKEGE